MGGPVGGSGSRLFVSCCCNLSVLMALGQQNADLGFLLVVRTVHPFRYQGYLRPEALCPQFGSSCMSAFSVFWLRTSHSRHGASAEFDLLCWRPKASF